MPTDNGNLKAKLDLRRYFLGKYHADAPPRVFDACQGSGVIWTRLRSEFAVASYWGVDMKLAKGRLAVDSRRLLAAGVPADVYDVDTWGSPWRHFEAILRTLKEAATVFLTLGNQNSTAMNPASMGAQILSLPPHTPPVLAAKIARKIAVRYHLTRCYEYGTIPVEIIEAIGGRTARYFGLRLQPESKSWQAKP